MPEPERDMTLLNKGWQYNSVSGRYRRPGGEWMDHAAAIEQAFGPRPAPPPPEPHKPTVLEEIRDELRLIRQAIEQMANREGRD